MDHFNPKSGHTAHNSVCYQTHNEQKKISWQQNIKWVGISAARYGFFERSCDKFFINVVQIIGNFFKIILY